MRAIIIFGIHEGYYTTNNEEIDCSVVIPQLQKILKDYKYNHHNERLTGIISTGRAIYEEDRGCPSTGEPVIRFETTYNREKTQSNEYEWKCGVRALAKIIREEYKQTTVTLEFIESSLHYIR